MSQDANNPSLASDDEEGCPFEAMGVGVGTRIQLVPATAGGQARYYTSVIGYVEEKYLIVQAPLAKGLPVLLREGEALTIHVFSGLGLFTFDTMVLHVFRSPFFYLHLDFPSVIRSSSLRKSIRVKVALAVEVKLPGQPDETIPARIVNLSATGAGVESSRPLGAQGDSLALDFSFTVQPGNVAVHVETKATIRSLGHREAASADAAQSFVFGVAFDHLASDQQVLLQNLVYETLLADRKNMA